MSFEDFTSTGPLAMGKEQAEEIFAKEYGKICIAELPAPERPTVYFVCGTQGSGKSRAIERGLGELPGATCTITPDAFPSWIPGYTEYAAQHPSKAFDTAVDAGSSYFAKEALNRAIGSKLNVILETAEPDYIPKAAAWFSDEGYEEVVLHFVAATHQDSWTGVMDRTEQALRQGNIGTNVIVPKNEHDDSYAGWPRIMFDAERDLPISDVIISRRDGTIVYRNQFGPKDAPIEDRNWKGPPHAVLAAFRLRHEPITEAIANMRDATWRRIVESKHMEADTGLKGLPREQYRSEIRGFDRHEMSRVDLNAQVPKFSLAAVNEWHKYVMADIDRAKKSDSYLGDSSEFADYIRRYANHVTFTTRRYAMASGLIRQPASQPSMKQAGNEKAPPEIAPIPIAGKKRPPEELETRAPGSPKGETSKRSKLAVRERSDERERDGGRA